MEPLEGRLLLIAGQLDPSFGSAGRASVGFTPPVSADEGASAIAVQPDGRTIVVGGDASRFGLIQLVRYNLDGSLDTSFGDGGRAAPSLGAAASASDIALQPDGKIVVLAHRNQTLAVARYLPDGSLDTSFDFDGWTAPFTGARYVGSAVGIQTDGKILVTGSTSAALTGPLDMLLARFNTNGSLDVSFGSGGIARADFGAAETASDLAILTDGRVGVVGCVNTSTGSDFGIACFTSRGALDTSFDGDGKRQIDFFGSEDLATSAVAHGDNIVLVGSAFEPAASDSRLVLARLRPDGSGDPTFGLDGSGFNVVTSITPSGSVRMALQADDKLVLSSFLRQPVTTVARFTASGLIDDTFDSDGRATISLPQGPWRAGVVTIAPDGRIVVAGTAGTVQYDFAAARFLIDGSVDTSFGGPGYVTTDFRFPMPSRDSLSDVATLPDGRVLLAGLAEGGWTAMARLTVDGALDTTFGTGGRLLIENGGDVTHLLALADGRFLAAGHRQGNIELRRFNVDGSIDLSFGTNGHALAPIDSEPRPTQPLLQPDGKIIVGARLNNVVSSETELGVIRFHADGTLDTSFDGDGMVRLTFPSSGFLVDVALAVNGKLILAAGSALYRLNVDGGLDTSFGTEGRVSSQSTWRMRQQADGKIVTLGTVARADLDLRIARYHADGSPDLAFGAGGIRDVNVQGTDWPAALELQADGKILIAGYGQATAANNYTTLVRLDVAGNLDNTFDDDGLVWIDTGGSEDPRALAAQPDGHVLLAGNARIGFSEDFHVIRFVGSDDAPAALSSAGKLTVTGTASDDAIAVRVSLGQVVVDRAGGPTLSVPQNRVTSILIRGLDGNDMLTFNGTLGRPTTFEGGTGANTLNVASASTFTFDADAAATTPSLRINVFNGSTVVFNASQNLAGLHIAAGGTALMLANGSRFLRTSALTVAEDAKLDLRDNDLLLDYTGDSPYDAIRDLVITGRSGGTQGIVTTSTDDTALAVVDNAQFGRTSWNDEPIDETTIIGKYTYYGDSNLDGKVTGDDYVAIDSNLGRNPGTSQWFHGDFNLDGYVTGDDYVAIDANLGDGTLDPAAYDEEQAEMIALHADRYGGRKYIRQVEAEARGKSRPVSKKASRGPAMKGSSIDLHRN